MKSQWPLLVLFAATVATPLMGQVPLRIALSENKPPYTMAKGGIEYDLVALIARAMGRAPIIELTSNERGRALWAAGELDAIKETSGTYLSEPYIAYRNAVIWLKRRNLPIDSIEDLTSYKVGAFQNAHLFLGPDFLRMTQSNPNYQELSPQIGINRLLYVGGIDVAISDIHVFQEFNTLVKTVVDTSPPLQVGFLLPPTRFSLAFHKRSDRDAFNAALKKVLADDPYAKLAKKYLPEGTEITFRP